MKRMPTASHAAPLAGLALRCQSDTRLVSLCREGQDRAFEEIVRRYRPQLVSFAGAIVPAHRAEDVVQEALTKAHASLAASHGEMKMKPWLYTIVRNRALNDLRDEPGHQHLDEDFDGVPQPPEMAAQRSDLAAVLAGVKSLPAAQREALLRRELEGRSHQEIAAAIGVTPGAVRGLIFRARTALREAAGVLIPLPAVRAMLNAGPLTTEATGASVGVGGAAAGLTAGGGGGLAIKAGTALIVAGIAVGSGVALHEDAHNREATAATVAQGGGAPGARSEAGPRHGALDGSGRSSRSEQSQSGRGPGSGGDSSGPGGGDGSSSGPGPSGSERGSSGGRDGRDDGGHHGGSGDDGPSLNTGDGGHDGSDDSPHGGTTGGEPEGGGATGGDHTGSGDLGDGGSSGSDDGASGGETTTSHDGTEHATTDTEASSSTSAEARQ
jgi:RNA polymerase sigma factor (sigma-70 family)